MTLMQAADSALVLVDYQRRLLPAIHQGESVLSRAVLLADAAHEMGIPVHGTEQNPDGLGPSDDAIRTRCDSVLRKLHFNACADGLVQRLVPTAGAPVQEVVIAGCEAHVCLLQTAIGLLQAGFRLRVVADASGSRLPENHALAMQRLLQCGASIVSAEMVVFEWMGTCEHPRFRRLLALLKK
jgi:nicotinamidase-related amidase